MLEIAFLVVHGTRIDFFIMILFLCGIILGVATHGGVCMKEDNELVFIVYDGPWKKGMLKASLVVPKDLVMRLLEELKEGESREVKARLRIDKYLEKRFGWVKILRIRCPKCSYPGWLRLRIRYGLGGNSADVYVDHGRMKRPRMCYVNMDLFDELPEDVKRAAEKAAKDHDAYLYSYLYGGARGRYDF